MKKYVIFVLMVFLTVAVGIQFSEPVDAASWVKIDKKTVYTYTGQHGYVKLVYNVYKKGKNRVMLKQTMSSKAYKWQSYGYSHTYKWYLTKISKTKLKILVPDIEGNYRSVYVKTKYSAVNYYWKVYRKSKYMKRFPST